MSPTEQPAPWTGASGTRYIFYVFALAPDVPSRPGNFIYAKRNAEGAWVPIYMGHGDLAACCRDPGRLRCIAEKSATHLHLRLNGREDDREAELQDLLAHYANAFAPEGCHFRTTEPEPFDGSGTSKAPPRTAKRGKAAPTKDATGAAVTKTVTRRPAKKAAAEKRAAEKPDTVKAASKAPVKAKPRTPRPRSK